MRQDERLCGMTQACYQSALQGPTCPEVEHRDTLAGSHLSARGRILAGDRIQAVRLLAELIDAPLLHGTRGGSVNFIGRMPTARATATCMKRPRKGLLTCFLETTRAGSSTGGGVMITVAAAPQARTCRTVARSKSEYVSSGTCCRLLQGKRSAVGGLTTT
jgi:hypothetical protein